MRRFVLCLLAMLLCVPVAASGEDYAPIALTDDAAYAVNLFLSNFTEVGVKAVCGGSLADADNEALVDFAHDHLWFNDPDAFENGDYFNGNNCRVADDEIQDILNRYFYDAPKVDLSITRFDYDGAYYYHCETGGWISDGFAMATSMCPLGDDAYFVSFLVFGAGENWSNDDLHLSISEAGKKYGHPNGYGSALVHASDIEVRKTYKMISFGRI